MATLDLSGESKLAALIAAKHSLAQMIVMGLIQLGYSDPFSVDIDTLEIPDSEDTFLIASMQKNIQLYKNVCAGIAELS